MKKQLYTLLFIGFALNIGLAQQLPFTILERTVSVRFSGTLLKESLKEVAQRGRFEFAYDARVFDGARRVTLISNDLTVREILFQLLGDNYAYQQKGDYLIIKKTNKPKQYISGYISDAKTGKRVSNATVYDAKTLRTTTTDDNGFYSLKVAKRSTVVVARLDYKDTILQITEGSPRFVKLNLDIKLSTKLAKKTPNWGKMPSKLANLFISSLHELNNLNVSDSIHRRFQISLLPFIGTNHRMSGNVVNDVSINALVGYSRGNNGVEIGGVGNFTRENSVGLQIGGVFNIVKSNVKGLQIGGVFNHVVDSLQGFQISGIWNYAHASRAINQTAGVVNLAPRGSVVSQIAGVVNMANDIKSSQIAGIVNVADSVKGGQIAGIVNLAHSIKGAQIAGIVNVADSINGVQIAGIVNVADSINGVQIASIVNKSRKIKGIQIGLFNHADTLKGLQIGLINYAKIGGYQALELSINELNNVNLAYKSGNRLLYIALIAGIKSVSNTPVWTYGYGIGTLPKLNNWSDVNVEALHRHVNVGAYSDRRQEWLQLGAYWNIHLGKRFTVSFGPNYNALLMDKSAPSFAENREKIFPRFIQPKQLGTGNAIAETWFGGQLGLRVKL